MGWRAGVAGADAAATDAAGATMVSLLLLAASLCLWDGASAESRWAAAPPAERGEPPYPYPTDRKYNTGEAWQTTVPLFPPLF